MLRARQRSNTPVAVDGILYADEDHWKHSWGKSTRSPRAADLEGRVSDEEQGSSEEDGIDSVLAWGVFLILVGLLFLCSSAYALVISKLLPFTGNWMLDSVGDDR
jgi:hypothetical protein